MHDRARHQNQSAQQRRGSRAKSSTVGIAIRSLHELDAAPQLDPTFGICSSDIGSSESLMIALALKTGYFYDGVTVRDIEERKIRRSAVDICQFGNRISAFRVEMRG